MPNPNKLALSVTSTPDDHHATVTVRHPDTQATVVLHHATVSIRHPVDVRRTPADAVREVLRAAREQLAELEAQAVAMGLSDVGRALSSSQSAFVRGASNPAPSSAAPAPASYKADKIEAYTGLRDIIARELGAIDVSRADVTYENGRCEAEHNVCVTGQGRHGSFVLNVSVNHRR